MLDTVAKEGSEHVISWIPGMPNSFKVHKPSVFVQEIMPRFFQQSKYKVSFVLDRLMVSRTEIRTVEIFSKMTLCF